MFARVQPFMPNLFQRAYITLSNLYGTVYICAIDLLFVYKRQISILIIIQVFGTHPIDSLHPNGTKLPSKCILDKFFLCVQMGKYLIFLQILLLCEEILLEKYPVWQLAMLSCLVVKQNFLNTNVIVNYHILIIHNWSGYGYFNFHSNWQICVRCWSYNIKWIAILITLFEKSMCISMIFW